MRILYLSLPINFTQMIRTWNYRLNWTDMNKYNNAWYEMTSFWIKGGKNIKNCTEQKMQMSIEQFPRNVLMEK